MPGGFSSTSPPIGLAAGLGVASSSTRHDLAHPSVRSIHSRHSTPTSSWSKRSGCFRHACSSGYSFGSAHAGSTGVGQTTVRSSGSQ
jgi:hypothetical protein